MTYTIRLANCTFHAHHGVLQEEATLGQRFHVDVAMEVAGTAALVTDEVSGTVHYGEAFALVERIVTRTRRNLIEALANDVCVALLEAFESIEGLEVTVRKPSVPIAGILDHASVTVRRTRGE